MGKNEDLSREVKDLKKSNNEFMEEISTVKDKLEKLEKNDSLYRSPQQTISQNRTEQTKEISEIEKIEEDEPTNIQEMYTIEEVSKSDEEEEEEPTIAEVDFVNSVATERIVYI